MAGLKSATWEMFPKSVYASNLPFDSLIFFASASIFMW